MCAFRDDADGEVYVYFGGLWGGQLQRYKDNIHLETPYLPEGKEDSLPSRCVRLTKDGLNFAEAPRPIQVVDEKGNPLKADDPHRFFEASWMHKYKGKYYFSYSTGDSHLLCYATGDNPYGPFTYQGVFLRAASHGSAALRSANSSMTQRVVSRQSREWIEPFFR